MVKDRVVTTIGKSKVDTIPKVSSILWYMGHPGLLYWVLITNFHFSYRLLNHFYLDQGPARNSPSLYISIWGHLLWLTVEGSWPPCVNCKSWDCAKEEKDVQEEEKWNSSFNYESNFYLKKKGRKRRSTKLSPFSNKCISSNQRNSLESAFCTQVNSWHACFSKHNAIHLFQCISQLKVSVARIYQPGLIRRHSATVWSPYYVRSQSNWLLPTGSFWRDCKFRYEFPFSISKHLLYKQL